MTTGVNGPPGPRSRRRRCATDRWWLAPLTTFVVFTAFVVYATWRAFSGSDYYSAPYLSPFYSPCLTTTASRARPTSASRSLVAAVAGADHPDLPARLPDDLLLLPQGLLPGVLAVPAGLRGRRAARQVLRRDPVPADPAEHPPLLLVRRGRGRADPDATTWCWRSAAEGESTASTWASAPLMMLDQRRADLALHAVAATRAGTSSAAGCGTSPSTRSATSSGPGSRSSTSTTPSTPGLPVLGRAGRPLHLPARHRHVIDDPRFF